MKNNAGFSWPETILSLSITFVIAATLLPLLNNLTAQLEEKKRQYHASVVMHEAAKMYIAENVMTGIMDIEEITYKFSIDYEQICVTHEGMRGEKVKCVDIPNGS